MYIYGALINWVQTHDPKLANIFDNHLTYGSAQLLATDTMIDNNAFTESIQLLEQYSVKNKKTWSNDCGN